MHQPHSAHCGACSTGTNRCACRARALSSRALRSSKVLQRATEARSQSLCASMVAICSALHRYGRTTARGSRLIANAACVALMASLETAAVDTKRTAAHHAASNGPIGIGQPHGARAPFPVLGPHPVRAAHEAGSDCTGRNSTHTPCTWLSKSRTFQYAPQVAHRVFAVHSRPARTKSAVIRARLFISRHASHPCFGLAANCTGFMGPASVAYVSDEPAYVGDYTVSRMGYTPSGRPRTAHHGHIGHTIQQQQAGQPARGSGPSGSANIGDNTGRRR